MKQYKSLSQVLFRGQIMINGPVMFFIIGTPVLFMLLLPKFFPVWQEGTLSIISPFLGIILGVAIGWAWWSYSVVKWRIWAFENTPKMDWPLLQQRAVQSKLIWEDGSEFEKTEFRNSEEEQKIKLFSQTINALEAEKSTESKSLESIDDDFVPEVTRYYYKKIEVILSGILPLIFIIMIFYFLRNGQLLVVGVTIVALLAVLDVSKMRDLFSSRPQLILHQEGIRFRKLKKDEFINWENTGAINVDTLNGIFTFTFWEGEFVQDVTISLKDFAIKDYHDFLRRINVYLKRNDEKQDAETAAM